MYELETPRLIMRQWKNDDYSAFARMNACPTVMKYFPEPMSSRDSNLLADKISALIEQNGWGLWALEEKCSGRFLGFTGLHPVAEDLPFYPAVEIGWRLDKAYWGQGFATEAAASALRLAFEVLGLERVVSFTATINQPSIQVMKRLGMMNSNENFNHPRIPDDSTLSLHVLYTITRLHWQKRLTN